MKTLLFILASCFLSSCITTAKYASKTDSPKLLRNITLYTTHYEGQGKSREEVNSYKEIIYFDSRGSITVLRPDIADRLKRVSIGEWRMEGEDSKAPYKISKTENSTRVRVQVKSTPSSDPRPEKHLCLDIWYAVCSEDDKHALSERCYQSKTNCYLEKIGEPIGLNDGSFRLHYTANHVYEEDFGRKYRRNTYRNINSFEVFREEKGDPENLKNLWKETRIATKERLEQIKFQEEERLKQVALREKERLEQIVLREKERLKQIALQEKEKAKKTKEEAKKIKIAFSGKTLFLSDKKDHIHILYANDKKRAFMYSEHIDQRILGGSWNIKIDDTPLFCINVGLINVGMFTEQITIKNGVDNCFNVKYAIGNPYLLCKTGFDCSSAYNIVKIDDGDSMKLMDLIYARAEKNLKLARKIQTKIIKYVGKSIIKSHSD